jgi:DNA-binding NarL/FixJ family response regulator
LFPYHDGAHRRCSARIKPGAARTKWAAALRILQSEVALLSREVGAPRQNTYTEYAKAFRVLGDAPGNIQRVLSALAQQGYYEDPAAPVTLLFDMPLGFGLHMLQITPVLPPRLIIITQNRCPEYWDDLWDFHPTGVLLESDLERQINLVFALVARTGRYRSVPAANSQLTRTERKVLCLLACGNSNPQIAERVGVQHKTIRNVLTTIYEKLGLENRTDTLLYYWDTWQGCARIAR